MNRTFVGVNRGVACGEFEAASILYDVFAMYGAVPAVSRTKNSSRLQACGRRPGCPGVSVTARGGRTGARFGGQTVQLIILVESDAVSTGTSIGFTGASPTATLLAAKPPLVCQLRLQPKFRNGRMRDLGRIMELGDDLRLSEYATTMFLNMV